MFRTILILITAVALTKSALECNPCVSTVDWDDCLKNSTREICTHYCFLREDMDPVSQTIHFKQGCTDDRNVCRNLNTYCSVCLENNALCTSLRNRITTKAKNQKFHDIDMNKPYQNNISAIVTMPANNSKGSHSTASTTSMSQNEVTHGKNVSQNRINDLSEYGPSANLHTDEKVQAETETTSTDLPVVKATTSTGPKATTDNSSAMIITAPPYPFKLKAAACSASKASAYTQIFVLIIAINFIFLRI